MKDLVNSIESAQVLYTIQEGNRETRDDLWRAGSDLEYIKQPPSPKAPPERKAKAEAREEWFRLDWVMASYQIGLDSLVHLMGKLPDSNEFKDRIDSVRFEESRIAGVVASQHNTFPPVQTDLPMFDAEIRALNRDILAKADEVRENRERWFKRVTLISYIFYGAGSIVGLLLALFGKREVAGAG